jgi:hypothetical protein
METQIVILTKEDRTVKKEEFSGYLPTKDGHGGQKRGIN